MNDYSLPYYAVIFTSKLSAHTEGYEEMAQKMIELAKKQDGFLGIETARSSIGITVSYWKSINSIQAWREDFEHQKAIKLGKKKWYDAYSIKICKVIR